MEKTMVPRFGVTIIIAPRGLPFAVIGTTVGALGLWVEAPVYAVAVGAFLITFQVTARLWKRQTI
ncbi:hypothetical protein ACFY9R_31345 [Streptomyces albidoflavus]|uniref:hypothetical protein n=1 Tax=Streptomyces albidoflavus TaxID=1886 RepID=UPI001F5C752E|nr:hypothetical protein [Streptomyces albidoflavus]WTD98101.1 hypothetical protein OG950_17810 [Streptomyces albidoflavus]